MSFKSFFYMLPLAIVASGSLASADTIGGLNSPCGTCAGAAYTLTYSGSPIATTATTQTFQITFDVNDRHYSGGGSFLNAVAIKVAAPTNVVNVSLFSAPSTFSYIGMEGLTANGCAGGGSGFLCVQSSGLGASVTGGPYNFVYDVTVKTGTLFTALNQSSVKARYVDVNGDKTGPLMSENITLQRDCSPTTTPEPASYLMLGSGLLGLGFTLKKRGFSKQS